MYITRRGQGFRVLKEYFAGITQNFQFWIQMLQQQLNKMLGQEYVLKMK